MTKLPSRANPGSNDVARQVAVLVGTAIAAATIGGVAVLTWRRFERRQQGQHGGTFDPRHRSAASAISERCWQWLDEAAAEEAASTARGVSVTADDAAGVPGIRANSSNFGLTLSALSGRPASRGPGSAVWQHGHTSGSTGFGWDSVLSRVPPPPPPPGGFLSRGSSQGSGSLGLDSTGSQPQVPLPRQTAAQALTSNSGLTDLSLQHAGEAPSDGDSNSAGTAELEELQLVYSDDGNPMLLGRGAFGQVYKAYYQSEEVAVKVFPLDLRAKGEANFRREISMLQSLSHDNIVGFKAACLGAPNHLLMVMELAQGGDLRTALDTDEAGTMLWLTRAIGGGGRPEPGCGKDVALGIARALEFLHSRHIVHLDLKSPNVLLSAQKVAKVADVGLARFMPNDYLSQQAAIGTFAWAAPEVLMGAKCSTKADIFSLGVILWELITGEAPHRGQMRPIRVPEECPVGVADLVAACMEERASKRPDAKEVVRLLSGQAASLDLHRAQPFEIDAPRDHVEPDAVSQADHKRLSEFCDRWTFHVFGGRDKAFAAGYTVEPLDTVVECVRPCDATTFMAMLDQLAAALESPDIDDPASAPHRQCVEMMHHFTPNLVLKVQLSSRIAVELRSLDIDSLAKTEAAEVNASSSSGSATSSKELPDPEKWRTTLQALRLSRVQADALAQARLRLGDRFSELREGRRQTVAQLRLLTDSGDFDGALTASTSLRTSINAESVALFRYQDWLLNELLEPLQYARALLAAQPLLPDGVHIGALLLSDRGQRLDSDAL